MFRRELKKGKKGMNLFSTLNLMSISTLVALLLIMQSSSFLIGIVKNDQNVVNLELKESQWGIIESVIRETNKEAQKEANSTAAIIEDDLLNEYDNNLDLLKHDMQYNSSNNKFLEVLKRNLETKDQFKSFAGYMTGIVTNTDNYFSLNPNEGIERTWQDELSIHYNKELAKNSIKSFTERSERLKDTIRFWEKEFSDNPDHIKINTMNLEKMKEVFIKEGIDGLKNYTFFAVSYITPSGDIFGVPDIDIQGNENSNNKIFIAHTFNIYDILIKDYRGNMEKVDKSILHVNNSASKQISIIKFVSFTLITIIIFIYCMVSIYLRKRILQIKNSYLNIKK